MHASPWGVAAVGVLVALPAAAADADLHALREEIAQMKQAYEQRIAALESKLAETVAKVNATEASAPAPRMAASQPPASEAAFNPAISAVLMGTYTRLSRDPEHYAIGGFVPSGGEIGPPRRSFGLGESEIGIAANIDPTLRGQLTVALTPENEAKVEEAYVQTLGLGHGATLRAGRFLSGIGYLNGQHAHAWDFADAPLAYRALLGGQLKSDGVQLKWVAPTALLFELGAEAASGGSFPATDRDKNGTTVGAVFARLGGDAGTAHSWRVGLSLLGSSPRDREYADRDSAGPAVTNAFSGRSRTLIADAVWKWAPEGNASVRNLVVQGEYFRRHETGRLAFDVNGAGLEGGYASRQSGGYAQAVYQFMPRWRLGYRYDRLDAGRTAIGLVAAGMLPAADFPLLAADQPQRNTVMIDYAPSEFSRWRLQFARDRSRLDAADNQLWLQYVASLGAHGAHAF